MSPRPTTREPTTPPPNVPKGPAGSSTGSSGTTKIVLVCGRGWGKSMALEQWEALWQEMFDNEEENENGTS